MRSLIIAVCSLMAVLVAGCNLTMAPPTPTITPTLPPTFAVPASPLPVDVTPVNPNCSATPQNWLPYVIVEGDNLSALAEETGTTVNELVINNCLDNPDEIFAGFIIFLPALPPS